MNAPALSFWFFFRSQAGTYAGPVLLALAILFAPATGRALGPVVAVSLPTGLTQGEFPAGCVSAGFGVTQKAAVACRGTGDGIPCRTFTVARLLGVRSTGAEAPSFPSAPSGPAGPHLDKPTTTHAARSACKHAAMAVSAATRPHAAR